MDERTLRAWPVSYPPSLRRRRKGGVGPGRPKTAPQADPAGTPPMRSARAVLAASRPAAPGTEPEPPTPGPAHRRRPGPGLTPDPPRAEPPPPLPQAPHPPPRRRRRARRGHANEPTVSAAPRRARASYRRALVRRRKRPPPSPLAQARCSLLQGRRSRGKRLICWGRRRRGAAVKRRHRRRLCTPVGSLSFTCTRSHP